MVDFFGFAGRQARLFWVLMAVGAVLFVAGAYPLFSHAMHFKQIQQSSHAQAAAKACDCCGGVEHTEASHD